jgi:hypothetical protein
MTVNSLCCTLDRQAANARVLAGAPFGCGMLWHDAAVIAFYLDVDDTVIDSGRMPTPGRRRCGHGDTTSRSKPYVAISERAVTSSCASCCIADLQIVTLARELKESRGRREMMKDLVTRQRTLERRWRGAPG